MAPARLHTGATGHFVDHVFKRAATQPATPTGNGTPSGWSDAPPAADGNPLWMSVAEKTAADVLVGTWAAPIQLDGAPGASAPQLQSQYSIDGSTSWHGTYAGTDLYMRTSANGGSTWSGAIRIKGEVGANAPQVQFQYSIDGSTGWHTTPTASDYYMRTSADGGSTWSTAVKIRGEDGADGSGVAGHALTSAGLAVGNPSAAYVELQTLTLTNPGATQSILGSLIIANNTAAVQYMSYKLTRGAATVLKEVTASRLAAGDSQPITLSVADAPGAGSQTYKLWAKCGANQDVTAFERELTVI